MKRSWTPRSAESIVREIEQIDADLIFFVDDIFTYQPDRVIEICDLLIAKKIRKRYVVNARSEIANRPDVLRKMEQAGFLALLIGVEFDAGRDAQVDGQGFRRRPDSPAVCGPPQIENDHQRLFHCGQHR